MVAVPARESSTLTLALNIVMTTVTFILPHVQRTKGQPDLGRWVMIAEGKRRSKKKKKGCKYLAPVVVAGSGQRIINNIGCTLLDPTRNGGDLEVDRVPSAPSRGVLRAEEVQTCKHMFVSYCGVDVVAKTCVKKSLLCRQQGGKTVVRKHCIARVYQCYWLCNTCNTPFAIKG